MHLSGDVPASPGSLTDPPLGQQRSDTPPLGESEQCTEFLAHHGLIIHDEFLICRECKSVIDFRKVRAHFTSQHKDLRTTTSMQREFDSLVLPFHPFLIVEPEHPKNPVPRNPYLETRSCYRVIGCLVGS